MAGWAPADFVGGGASLAGAACTQGASSLG